MTTKEKILAGIEITPEEKQAEIDFLTIEPFGVIPAIRRQLELLRNSLVNGFINDQQYTEGSRQLEADLAESNRYLEIVRNAKIKAPIPDKAEILVTGINFGDITVNTETILPLTIKNTGNIDLVIEAYSGFGKNVSFDILSPVSWPDITPSSPLIIKSNESKALDVKFSPTGIYPISVNIKFESNSTGGSNTALIKGNATQAVDLGIGLLLPKRSTGSFRILTLKNIREIFYSSQNNPDITSPYFDNEKTNFRSSIVADIWQCYTPAGETNKVQKLLLSDVIISKGVGSFWYENCNDFLGGIRPTYQYYYDLDEMTNIENWDAVIKEDYDIQNNKIAPGFSITNSVGIRLFKDNLNELKQEIELNQAYWGNYDSNNANQTLCQRGNDTDRGYIQKVLNKQFTSKSFVKIYGGFSENRQRRSPNLINASVIDLDSNISGNNVRQLNVGFISKKSFGRLNCLQPRTGCFIVSERQTIQTRPVGDEIVKLLNRPGLPEKIPNDPCYRGFRTKYVRGYNWERRWEVELECISGNFTEYEWRESETEFFNRGTTFEVWEDVEFAGTEIGFSENCIPMDIAKEQEPYVDMSDFNGCYEIQTSKIFKKYADYKHPGERGYIKGPEVLSTQNYSGLGPGIKLNRKITKADCIDTPVKIFHPFHVGTDVIVGRDNLKTAGSFNKRQSPQSYHTSSIQNELSKKYYHEIVDTSYCPNQNPISYFSVAYGNKNGSGSLYEGYETNDSPTRAIYSQTRLLALESNETEFKFYTNGVLGSRGDIYIINFNRDSLSDRIDPGNFEINLKSLAGLSNNVMTFIDNSEDILESKFSNDYAFTAFDIVSGSLTNGIHNSGTGSIETNPNITTYGKIYPNLGIIVFDAEKLDDELDFSSGLSINSDSNNSYKLFTSISGAASLGYHLKARASKNNKSNHYFVKVTAGSSNYSNNPTMVNENNQNNNIMKYNYFKYNPITYITTVGLYNDAKELLAVAKLSKPILKTPNKDILIKIRLNW
jgi:hypothetical protein